MNKVIGWAVAALVLTSFNLSNLCARQPAHLQAQSGAASSTSSGDAMSNMPGMAGQAPAKAGSSPLVDRPWCEDTTWSVFNHRTSGWFLLFWGLTALIAGLQWPRRTWVRFVPAMILFGLAEFLFFRNDPEAWPVGPMSFSASLHNPEDLQHRIFLLLVILIAVVELLRAAARLSKPMATYALPALGTFGAVYLFFHKHGGPEMEAAMSNPQAAASGSAMQHAMASMALVKHEHLWFSIFGFALVAAKLLADAGYIRGRKAALWSVFAITLGAYMIGYVE